MFSPSSDINPCHSLFFDRDHLRSNMGIISGLGSFAVQFGDHLWSRIICGPWIICGPVQTLLHYGQKVGGGRGLGVGGLVGLFCNDLVCSSSMKL